MENLNLTMFKQYDIRTRHNALTDPIKERLYNAVAIYLRDYVKAKSVVIGRDARLYVPELAEGLARVARKAGVEVLINPLPISTCQFYLYQPRCYCLCNSPQRGPRHPCPQSPGPWPWCGPG